ncbi:MAG TPA: hypothetical protein PLP73_02670 [Candidatus Absconditabacterales bacterium]|nr:hypothetical protein [Candidatus Absconditabacterales bacterium]
MNKKLLFIGLGTILIVGTINTIINIQAMLNCNGCSAPWQTALISTGFLYIIIGAIYRFTYLLLSYLKKNSEQLSSNKKQKK